MQSSGPKRVPVDGSFSYTITFIRNEIDNITDTVLYVTKFEGFVINEDH